VVLILFGPPGCGKGTQAERITATFGLPAISTGALLRSEVAAKTDLGVEVQSVMASGAFVSDELVTKILLRRLKDPDSKKGFLLDGYPRTLKQALTLGRFFKKQGMQPVVVHLDVPEELIVGRITSRRQCSKCGHIYNLISQPPAVEGKCDVDGAELTIRADDQDEVIRARLKAYHELTGPAIDHYKSKTYHRIDGSKSPDEVFAGIHAALQPSLVGAGV
jgi:adenylate kinase